MTDFKDTIINKLQTLATNERIQNQPFKARAYNIVIKQLKDFKGKIVTVDDISQFKGVGIKIKAKIEEIISTGTLKAADRVSGDNINIFEELTAIHGIGPTKARALIKEGIVSIDDLKLRAEDLLNTQQQIGLKYHDDIQKRIPRKVIDKHKIVLDKCVTKVSNKLLFTIVGSYRRMAKDSGDIDILITIEGKSTEKKRTEMLEKLIDVMKEENYIVADLSCGKKKYMGVVKLGRDSVRRLDILMTSPQEYPYALLYFTGSKELNVELRLAAQQKGLVLNEHGLQSTKKVPRAKTEEDIFNILGYKYILPEHRTGSNFAKYKLTQS